MRMSTVYAMKGGMLAEPIATGREEDVCGSEVYLDCPLGEYLYIPPLCIQDDSMSPVLFCAKASLQRKCLETFVCHGAVEPRGPPPLMPECLIEAWSSRAIMP